MRLSRRVCQQLATRDRGWDCGLDKMVTPTVWFCSVQGLALLFLLQICTQGAN